MACNVPSEAALGSGNVAGVTLIGSTLSSAGFSTGTRDDHITNSSASSSISSSKTVNPSSYCLFSSLILETSILISSPSLSKVD